MRTKEILRSPFSQEMLIVAQEKIKALDEKKNQILDKIFMECSASLQGQSVKEHPIQAKPVFVQENQIQTAMTTIAHSNDNKIVAPAIIEQKPSDDDEALLHAWEAIKHKFIKENPGANDVPLKAVEIRKWMDENKDYLNSVSELWISPTQDLPDWFFNYFKNLHTLYLGQPTINGKKGHNTSLPSSLAETNIVRLNYHGGGILPDWVSRPTASGKVPMPHLQELMGYGLICADYADPKRIAKVDYFFRSHPALLGKYGGSFTADAPLATTDTELWHKHKNDKIMSVILKICVVVVASLMLLHMMNKT